MRPVARQVDFLEWVIADEGWEGVAGGLSSIRSNTGLKVTLSNLGVGSAGWVSDMCSE